MRHRVEAAAATLRPLAQAVLKPLLQSTPVAVADGLAGPSSLSPGMLVVLKWAAIVLPLSFLAVWLYIVTGPLYVLSHSVSGFSLLLAGTASAVVAFALVLFGAIERLQAALVQRNYEVEALLALGRRVTGSLDVDSVAQQATRGVVDAAGVDAAELWLVDEGGTQIVRRAHHRASPGSAATVLDRGVYALGEGLPGAVARSGRAEVLREAPRDGASGGSRDGSRDGSAAGARTFEAGDFGGDLGVVAVLPLAARDRTAGVLVVAASSPRALEGPAELRLVEAMCDRIAIALENARLHEQAESAAVITERERIARELHDGMAQVLTYINIKTYAIDRSLDRGEAEDAREQLQQMAEIARSLYADVREEILSLRSQVGRDGDFLAVLGRYLQEFEGVGGFAIEFRVEVTDEQMARLAPGKEVQVLRIVQEALSNVRKHAGATRAEVALTASEDELKVVVRDDGRGFEPASVATGSGPRFGLQSMDERARSAGGTLEIDSAPGRGTAVTLRCPWASPRGDPLER